MQNAVKEVFGMDVDVCDPGIASIFTIFNLQSGKCSYHGFEFAKEMKGFLFRLDRAKTRLDFHVAKDKDITNLQQVVNSEEQAYVISGKMEDKINLEAAKRILEEAKKDVMFKLPQYGRWKLMWKIVNYRISLYRKEIVDHLTKTPKLVIMPQLNKNGEMLKKAGLSHWNKRLLGLIGFSKIIQMVKYKQQKKGGQLLLVTEDYSTQTCSCCGHFTRPGYSRVFQCSNPKCKARMCRDENAARNILVVRDGWMRMI